MIWTVTDSDNGQLIKTTSHNKALKVFNETVTAFLDGAGEEPANMVEESDYFYFEYEDGDTFEVKLDCREN